MEEEQLKNGKNYSTSTFGSFDPNNIQKYESDNEQSVQRECRAYKSRDSVFFDYEQEAKLAIEMLNQQTTSKKKENQEIVSMIDNYSQPEQLYKAENNVETGKKEANSLANQSELNFKFSLIRRRDADSAQDEMKKLVPQSDTKEGKLKNINEFGGQEKAFSDSKIILAENFRKKNSSPKHIMNPRFDLQYSSFKNPLNETELNNSAKSVKGPFTNPMSRKGQGYTSIVGASTTEKKELHSELMYGNNDDICKIYFYFFPLFCSE